ncbi:10859_t:CDS:1, partial [Paraglomus occultum]
MVKDPDLKPIHPGEILKSEFLEPLNMKGEELAKNIQVKKSVIRELLAEKRRMTVDLAYRLYFYFG